MNTHPNNQTSRENFLLSLLNKVTKEYKSLLQYMQINKPLKIIEVCRVSTVPGETEFLIQVTNKNYVFKISAAQLLEDKYSLTDFSKFHQEMIRQALLGKLIDYLKISESNPTFRIVSKRFDKSAQQHIFTLISDKQEHFMRSAPEIVSDKNILENLGVSDVYDIGFTQGGESILKEKMALLLLKNQK